MNMFYGEWCSSGRPDLMGKRALLQEGDNGGVLAQFDDRALGDLAFGWHWFPRECFNCEIEEPEIGP